MAHLDALASEVSFYSFSAPSMYSSNLKNLHYGFFWYAMDGVRPSRSLLISIRLALEDAIPLLREGGYLVSGPGG